MNSNSSLEIKNLDTLEVISVDDLDKVVGGMCPQTFNPEIMTSTPILGGPQEVVVDPSDLDPGIGQV